MMILWFALAAFAGEKSAKDTIEAFYQAYIPKLGSKPSEMPKIAFTKAFRALEAKNQKVCAEKADGDICGWDADFDPYIDAQDYDEHLTAKSAGLKITEPKKGEVHVSLHVLPNGPKEYNKASEMVFKMKREDGQWKVDDLLDGGRSAREYMKKEIAELSKE